MCNSPRYFDTIREFGTGKKIPIPCHCCEGCRIDRRTLWEWRATTEFVKYRSAFVTLTYDEYHLPFNAGSKLPTVRHKDLTDFLDRLKHRVKLIPDNGFPELCTKEYKHIFISEYGSGTMRPHYHGLFFGLDWLHFKNLINECWYGGLVDVKPIKRGGIRYILKYMDTAQTGEFAHRKYTDLGLEIPKFSFSRGIGKEFFISQIENINKYGCAKVGNRYIPIPSYWKNKLFNFTDKNIYAHREFRNKYTQEQDRHYRSLGYNSYADFLQQTRKAIEKSYEKQLLKQHEPISNFSDFISDRKLPPESSLLLDY